MNVVSSVAGQPTVVINNVKHPTPFSQLSACPLTDAFSVPVLHTHFIVWDATHHTSDPLLLAAAGSALTIPDGPPPPLLFASLDGATSVTIPPPPRGRTRGQP